MVDRSSAGRRSQRGLPSNTIVVSCAGEGCRDDALEGTVFAGKGVTARQRIGSQAGGLHVVEGPHFSLFAHGHLYCSESDSLDPDQNLRILLERLERGDDLASALRSVAGGLFAFFVLDHRRRTLAVTVDRQGFQPLFYRADRAAVHFSNDQFFLGTIEVLSEVALHEYLKYGYLPFSGSLFESVHRIAPGETIIVDLSECTATCCRNAESVSPPPVPERYQSTEEATPELVAAFDKYFARLDGRRWAVGLSGGYDSRLIAAYLADREVSLINFGNPRSREVRFARRAAARLGRELTTFEIPVDALRRYGRQFAQYIRPLDSLEDAHILALVDAVVGSGVQGYVDGFLGDTVVGAGYYYKLAGGSHSLCDTLTLRDRWESPLREPVTYSLLLYHRDKRSLPDALLPWASAEMREEVQRRAAELVQREIERCSTHEDAVEVLTRATRGRALIAGGPVAIASYVPCACPFIDHRIFDVCMRTARAVRAGDRLYNAFWRTRFPGLADLAKGDTGGRPHDGDHRYRLKHLASAVMRRAVFPRLKRWTRGRLDLTEEYSSIETYVRDPCNAAFVREAIERYVDLLSPHLAKPICEATTDRCLDARVAVRTASLLLALRTTFAR